MFAISATNSQLIDPQNIENLMNVSKRFEKLRKLLSADRKTYAGILPGILYHKRIIRDAPEADLTAMALSQAINLVKKKEFLDAQTHIIVLGGKGFIGRRLLKILDPSTTYSIDSIEGQCKNDWPTHLKGKRIIVINITKKDAIKDYLEILQPGTIVINEVYPEPSLDILEKLMIKNCTCYHVVGVRAFALPSFPEAYNRAIPCCAAWPSPEMKVVVRKIN